MAVDMVGQLIWCPDIASPRQAEAEIHARTQAYKKAVIANIDKVNTRMAVTAAKAPGAVGASECPTAPTGTATSSGSRSVIVREFS